MAILEAIPSQRQASQFIAQKHQLLIDGTWVDSASGQTFESLNPATEAVLAHVAHGNARDIDLAVAAARRAFEDRSPWRRMTPSDRGRLLHRIGDMILEHGDELALLESLDNGKPVAVARAADVVLAADLFHSMAGWATKIEGNTIDISALPAPGEYLAFTLREPVGVVGQIIPWNFPMLMAAWKLGPMLATGCTVVLKPAEQTPLTALRLGELLLEAGLPNGVVNIVTGFGEEAGAPLAAHPDVDKVAFTGSREVGRLIVQAAAGNLKKVSLELGGKSPNVVHADADMELAIPGAANAILFNHGQCCNAGSRLYVERPVYDRVVEGVSEAASSIKVGIGTDPDSQIGPLISDEQFGKVLGYLASGRSDGARAAVGGERVGSRGYFVQPTLLTNTRPWLMGSGQTRPTDPPTATVGVVAYGERSARLTLGEWAVLGLVASEPVHAFAIVKALAPRGELGRIWSVPTPVVYRAVNSLRDKQMLVTAGEERSDAGPPKTMLKLTPRGRSQLDAWLQTPVAHMREVRSELLLKLALLARLHQSAEPLVSAQSEAFEPVLAGLEQLAATAIPAEFEATLVGWRLESARAVMRFLQGLAVHARA